MIIAFKCRHPNKALKTRLARIMSSPSTPRRHNPQCVLSAFGYCGIKSLAVYNFHCGSEFLQLFSGYIRHESIQKLTIAPKHTPRSILDGQV